MHYVDAPLATQTRRVIALDALRGFSFIWILGGEGAVLALAEMSNDKTPIIGAIGNFLETQMIHAPWEGFRFYDFIFPLFIFIVGVAIGVLLGTLFGRRNTYLWSDATLSDRFVPISSCTRETHTLGSRGDWRFKNL
jgi:predicted acyltransferase